ncbi:hypothetical protein BD410DRAFT_635207 [Rickenella mellea]|uniref:Uncharacterized protein n=1 Tax=Rickenella mellea TaxID=50990 RepID=A0A4Y7QCA0_9AGAM|nr:hypothetical protein BD410DRAFT_635207 [Rickenella mellea]
MVCSLRKLPDFPRVHARANRRLGSIARYSIRLDSLTCTTSSFQRIQHPTFSSRLILIPISNKYHHLVSLLIWSTVFFRHQV